MLQRPQTIWIVMAILAAVCSFEFPFALVNDVTAPALDPLTHIDAGTSPILIILTILMVVLSGITLMTYSNIRKQKSFCWIGILLGVIICLVYLREWKSTQEATLAETSIIPMTIPIFFLLAWLGMDRDQKLIRKLGRTRKS